MITTNHIFTVSDSKSIIAAAFFSQEYLIQINEINEIPQINEIPERLRNLTANTTVWKSRLTANQNVLRINNLFYFREVVQIM